MTFFFCLVAIMYENILQAETPNRELPRAYSTNLNNNTQKYVNRGFIKWFWSNKIQKELTKYLKNKWITSTVLTKIIQTW